MTQTINLRKAASIQRELISAINEIKISNPDFNSRVNLTTFENPYEVIADKRKKFHNTMERVIKMNEVLYSIRDKVGTANSNSGISSKLTEVEKLKAIVAICKNRTETERESTALIDGKLQQLRANMTSERASSNLYAILGDVSTSVLSAEDVKEYTMNVMNTKKAIRDLNDQILTLNVSTVITLDEDETALLSSLQLI